MATTAKLTAILLWLLVASACHGVHAETTEPPSILLIVVDTLRADYLGAYGFRGEVSPAIDRLAAESVLFEEAHSVAPWTKPSMASLFTSLPPELHGVTNHEGKYWGGTTAATRTGVLVPAAVTLAEVLRAAGYRTAGFNANPWMIEKYGFAQGFDRWQEYPDHGATAQMLADGEAWLQPQRSDGPRLLYLHFMDVHAPYRGTLTDTERLRTSPSLTAGARLNDAQVSAIPSHLDGEPKLDAEDRHDVRAWRAKYAAGVTSFDRALGPFLERLRASGFLDRSLVVLVGDHGEQLFEHGGWDHGYTLHEELLHVPLLVRRPRGAAAGLRVRGVVTLLDVMPTVLALAGVSVPSHLHGRDLSQPLRGTERRVLIPDVADGQLASAALEKPELRALRVGHYRLIADPEHDSEQLYDVATDPTEQVDLATQRPELAAELRTILARRLVALSQDRALPSESVQVDPSTTERLRELGYMR